MDWVVPFRKRMYFIFTQSDNRHRELIEKTYTSYLVIIFQNLISMWQRSQILTDKKDHKQINPLVGRLLEII